MRIKISYESKKKDQSSENIVKVADKFKFPVADGDLRQPDSGTSKASKRKPEVSGFDQEGSSRAKRYDL